MHGRLKVKTTAEQEAEKQKERQKKCALFTAGSQKATEKRNLKEHDAEALSITGQLLQNNPDYYTMWNFRKELILSMISEQSNNEEEVQNILETELLLTEACLRKNVKSYGAWHHRAWALKSMPKPNWKKEISTCTKYLQLDERNFHVWNYRRIVCGLSDESPKEELSFTLKKIEENFSNYSAWHYRSSLLPRVHPGSNTFGPPVDQDILLKEYELVQNAVFTDPNDQSAWFYHRWLLGRGNLDHCIICCHFAKDQNKVVVVFNKPIKMSVTNKLSVLVNGEIFSGEWKTVQGDLYASTIWLCVIPASLNENGVVEVTFENESGVDQLKCTNSLATVWKKNYKDTLFRSELSAATSEVLQQELESCQQLLDLEPGNKWTLLTCVLLLRALNGVSHETTALEYLDQLISVDATRKNYYVDLRSKCVVENALTTFLTSPSVSLDLSKSKLSTFYHADHLVFLKTLNLSNNMLRSLHSLGDLVLLEELNVDYNQIEDCAGLEALKYLRMLSIKHNNINNIHQLSALKSCSTLCKLHVQGNPVSSGSDFIGELKQVLPALENVD